MIDYLIVSKNGAGQLVNTWRIVAENGFGMAKNQIPT